MDRVVTGPEVFEKLSPVVGGMTLVPDRIGERNDQYIISYTPNIATVYVPKSGSDTIRYIPYPSQTVQQLNWNEEPIVRPTLMWRKYTGSNGDAYYLVNEQGRIITDGVNCYRADAMDGETPTNWYPVNIGSEIVAIESEWGESMLVLYNPQSVNSYMITYSWEGVSYHEYYKFVRGVPQFELNEYHQ